MPWCEHCRDHFDADHYDEEGRHKTGDEFGPVGARKAEVERLRAALLEITEAYHAELEPAHTMVGIARKALGIEDDDA